MVNKHFINELRFLLLSLVLMLTPIVALADSNVTFTAKYANVEGNTNEKVGNIFNGDTTDKWCGNIPYSGSVYVEFEASEPVNVSSYYFWTGNDIGHVGQRNPKDWKLYARQKTSDEWTVIGTSDPDKQLPQNNSTRSDDYPVDASYQQTAYLFFRFEFTSIVSGNVFEIGELCLNCTAINPGEAEGEENTTGGVRSGRVKNFDAVTADNITYTLYKNYYYIPVESGAKQETLKKSVSGLSCVVTGCTATGEVVIPKTVTFTIGGKNIGVPVVALAEGLLNVNNNVTSISIPGTVVCVEKFALEDRKPADEASVSKLTTIIFADDEKPLFLHRGSEGYSPISFNAALNKVHFGRTIQTGASTGLFEGHSPSVLTVDFNDALTTLSANMLKGAIGLQTLQLPAKLTAIPESLCEGCTGLTAMVIPADVTSIGANAFAGCSNIAAYTLKPTSVPTVTNTSLSGTTNYTITVDAKGAPLGSYLATGSAWLTYEDHFVRPGVNATHHAQTEPTISTTGYSQECWEDNTTHKFYSDRFCTVEIDPLTVITYAKLTVDPRVTTDEYGRMVKVDDQVYGGSQFNWPAEAKYMRNDDCGRGSVEFRVYGKDVADAQIKWYKDEIYDQPNYGKFIIKVYVNGELKYTKEQGGNNMKGLFAVPLPELKTNDIVKFEVNKTGYASWAYDTANKYPTIAATLEYTRSGVIDKIPLTITADNKHRIKQLDGADPELTWQITKGALRPGESLENISINRASGDDPGNYAITVSQTDGSNTGYDITFVNGNFHIIDGIKHGQATASDTQLGYNETCWEDVTTHKLYKEDGTQELNPALTVVYPSLDFNPTIKNSTKFYCYNGSTYGGEKFGGSRKFEYNAQYYNSSSTPKHVDFVVNHSTAKDARITWLFDLAFEQIAKLYTFNVYKNGDLVKSVKPDGNQQMSGFHSVYVGDVQALDVISIKMDPTEDNDCYYSVAATLEYMKISETTDVLTFTANQDPDNTSEYYTTFYDSKRAYTVGEGAKAYTAKIEDGKMILTAIADNIIPKGEPVVLNSTSESLTLTPTSSDKQKSTDNVLGGSDQYKYTSSSDNYHILSCGQKGVGFYNIGEYKYLAAHKAYLFYNSSASANGLTMVFEDDVTGIRGIQTSGSDRVIYNLSGQRINSLQKGINIINGKKYVIK